MFNQTKKTQIVGRHFTLSDSDINKTVNSINKIIGQLETIKKDVINNDACDQTLTQILAIKGGVESVGRNLVGKGILDCLNDYSRDELEIIIKNLFKLD
jgi:DNA-binding FrmR family transcriptional regulator